MRRIGAVLFDWDGTLANTAEASFHAFQKSMEDVGVCMDFKRYASVYSPNWRHMLSALQVPKERWQEVEALWLNHYGSVIPDLMPEASNVLKELNQRKYCLGIVTSGSSTRILYELKHCGLEEFFRVVVCGDDVRNPKPHPEGLEIAIRHLGLKPETCFYVGDTPADVEMGKRANVQTIGIPGPYPGSRELPEHHPDLLLKSLGGILAHFS